jgi:hypothetical protein
LDSSDIATPDRIGSLLKKFPFRGVYFIDLALVAVVFSESESGSSSFHIFGVMLKSNLRHLPLWAPYQGYEMCCCLSLSQDSLSGNTTATKARSIKYTTRNGNFFKNEPILSGVAMSELSNSIKKHTPKSHETIPFKI